MAKGCTGICDNNGNGTGSNFNTFQFLRATSVPDGLEWSASVGNTGVIGTSACPHKIVGTTGSNGPLTLDSTVLVVYNSVTNLLTPLDQQTASTAFGCSGAQQADCFNDPCGQGSSSISTCVHPEGFQADGVLQWIAQVSATCSLAYLPSFGSVSGGIMIKIATANFPNSTGDTLSETGNSNFIPLSFSLGDCNSCQKCAGLFLIGCSDDNPVPVRYVDVNFKLLNKDNCLTTFKKARKIKVEPKTHDGCFSVFFGVTRNCSNGINLLLYCCYIDILALFHPTDSPVYIITSANPLFSLPLV